MLRRQRTDDAYREFFTVAMKLGWSYKERVEFLRKHPNTELLEKGIKKLKDEHSEIIKEFIEAKVKKDLEKAEERMVGCPHCGEKTDPHYINCRVCFSPIDVATWTDKWRNTFGNIFGWCLIVGIALLVICMLLTLLWRLGDI